MIRTLLKSVREYKLPSILAPVFVSLEVVMEVLIPMLMAQIIDKGVTPGDMAYIWKMGLLTALAAMLSLAFGVLSGKCAAKASAGFARNLRHDMFHNVQSFSFGNIDKFSTASLVTRLTTDVNNLQNSYQMVIRTAVRGPFMLISALFMSIMVNARLSLVFAVAIPILGVLIYFMMTRAHPIFSQLFKKYDRLNCVVQEDLRAIRVVKAYNREEREIEKFTDSSLQVYDYSARAERILAWMNPVSQFVIYGSMLAIAWISAQNIVAGSMTTGELMSMITYTMQILSSMMMLGMIFVMVTMSKAAMNRISEVITEQSTIANPEKPVTAVKDGSIDFDHVSFAYDGDPDKLCLTDIDFHIKSGMTVGILGGTGSGKSTLVQLIPRLYDVTKGDIKVGGVNVRDYDLTALRDSVSMVLQKNVLFSGSIKDNLRWGNPGASDEQLVEACKLAQADPFIQTFPEGYDSHIEQGGSNVSGGQKQRLCIARAVLKQPRILILDDSTSAVDTKTDAEIRRAFREKIPGVTKLIIAQRVASVEDADLVLIIDNGRLQGIGSPAELLKSNTIYQEVYYSQTRGNDDAE